MQSPRSQSETSQSAESTPNSQPSSFSVIDLTSPRTRSSLATICNNGSQDSVSRGLQSSGLDDICAESPTSSLGSPQLSTRESRNSEDQEEKENTLEGWRSSSNRTYSSPTSRRRLHLDFTLPPSFTDSNRAISSPSRLMQQRRLHSDQLTPAHSSPQSTHSMTTHSGRPVLGLVRGSASTITRLKELLHVGMDTSWNKNWSLERIVMIDIVGHLIHLRSVSGGVCSINNDRPISVATAIPSLAPRHRAESDEEASLALARYLQQQEVSNRKASHSAQELTSPRVQPASSPSTNSLFSGLVGHQRNIDPDSMSYEELLRLGEEVGDVKKERWRQMAVQVLSSLPTHRWTRGHGEDTCIVCQYNFVPNDRAMTLPCAHVFHEGKLCLRIELLLVNSSNVFCCVDCVGGWIRENNSCPLCKGEITPM
ncbi:Zinc finger, RING/FYVE/PHD-type [Phytophthora cactorum]|nr:Zinc finger, RING/FYVE/PHD-type [Phytophthora cactorum]